MCSSRFDSNDDWKRYPQNLVLAPLEPDACRNNTRISQLSKDLFVANNESTFEFIAIDVTNNGKASSMMSHVSAIDESTDDGHDVSTQQIQSTESLKAIMELSPVTSVVSVCFFDRAGQS